MSVMKMPEYKVVLSVSEKEVYVQKIHGTFFCETVEETEIIMQGDNDLNYDVDLYELNGDEYVLIDSF